MKALPSCRASTAALLPRQCLSLRSSSGHCLSAALPLHVSSKTQCFTVRRISFGDFPGVSLDAAAAAMARDQTAPIAPGPIAPAPSYGDFGGVSLEDCIFRSDAPAIWARLSSGPAAFVAKAPRCLSLRLFSEDEEEEEDAAAGAGEDGEGFDRFRASGSGMAGGRGGGAAVPDGPATWPTESRWGPFPLP